MKWPFQPGYGEAGEVSGALGGIAARSIDCLFRMPGKRPAQCFWNPRILWLACKEPLCQAFQKRFI